MLCECQTNQQIVILCSCFFPGFVAQTYDLVQIPHHGTCIIITTNLYLCLCTLGMFIYILTAWCCRCANSVNIVEAVINVLMDLIIIVGYTSQSSMVLLVLISVMEPTFSNYYQETNHIHQTGSGSTTVLGGRTILPLYH